MNLDIKTVIVIFTHFLLFFLTVMINNRLAPYSIHLSVAALYIIPVILHLQLGWGLIAVALQGLMLDSNFEPEAYGFHLILFTCLVTLLTYFKSTIRRSSYYQILILCTGINSLIMLIESMRWGSLALMTESAFWLRMLLDMTVSNVLLILITGWFIALQRQLIFFVGIDLNPEEDI